MSYAIHFDADDVDTRLVNLGIEREILRESVLSGFTGFSNQSHLAPVTFPGTVAWAETVITLAALLAPEWIRVDDGAMPFVVRGDGAIGLTVWTGNEQTGNPLRQPNVRARRGKKTIERVSCNERQLSLGMMPTPIGKAAEHVWQTWALLVYRDMVRRRVVSELSLPISMSPDQKVDGWEERIMLPIIDFDDDGTEDAFNGLPEGPDIDIPIIRRA